MYLRGRDSVASIGIRKEEIMKRVKLTVAYDGTNYHGWQIQPNGNTIEAELNRHLTELLGEEISVVGASRTDAGVHALGNVAVFDTRARMPADKISYAMNTRLPADIRIQDSCEVAADFHPRFCRTVKTYEYRILNRRFPDPTKRLYSFFITIRWMWKKCGKQGPIWWESMIFSPFARRSRGRKIRCGSSTL